MKTTANFENGKVNFSNGTELEMYQVQSIFNNRSIEEVREYLSEDENWDEEMIDALIECVEENN